MKESRPFSLYSSTYTFSFQCTVRRTLYHSILPVLVPCIHTRYVDTYDVYVNSIVLSYLGAVVCCRVSGLEVTKSGIPVHGSRSNTYNLLIYVLYLVPVCTVPLVAVTGHGYQMHTTTTSTVRVVSLAHFAVLRTLEYWYHSTDTRTLSVE